MLDPRPLTLRKLVWMAEPRKEWFEGLCRIIAAGMGIDLSESKILPYDPNVLKAIAESGRDIA